MAGWAAAGGLSIAMFLAGGLAGETPGQTPGAFLNLATEYRLVTQVDFDEARISATETVIVTNHSTETMPSLRFNVMTRAFGEFALTGPVTVDGEAATTFYSNLVTLEVATPDFLPGEARVVRIPFAETPSDAVEDDLDQRTSKANGILQAAQWFPILSNGHPLSRMGDSQFTVAASRILFDVTLNRPMTLAAPGKRLESRGLRSVYALDNARDYAFTVSPYYHVLKGWVGSTPVHVYYTNGDGAGTLDWSMKALSAYSLAYGSYPWPSYIVAQGTGPDASDEWPAITTIGELHMGSQHVITHEAAHQWWYGIVGNDQIEEPWLDEAFAEFSARHFFDIPFQYDSTLSVNLPARSFKTFCCLTDSYGQTVYYKGAALLDRLRRQMGNSAFFRALKAIQTTFRFRTATTAGVIAIFEAKSFDKPATDRILHAYLAF